MKNNNLKISIITVCFNSVKIIEETILSVLNQTYKNIEYIIIDGQSTDGTIEIIKKYANRISYWISEKDGGIFDAMNKGIKVATGDYINFMNAGDTFYSNKVLSKFVSKKPTEDILSGIAQVKIPSLYLMRYWTPARKNFKFYEIRNGMAANHQSSFIKRHILKEGYDKRYTIISDDLFFIKKTVYEGISYRPIGLIVAKYDCNGISSNPRSKEIRDYERYTFYKENPEERILNKYKSRLGNIKGYVFCRALYFRIFNQIYPRIIQLFNY